VIDIIRGFALLGVLLSNLVWVALYCGTPEHILEGLPTRELDEIVDLFGLTFVQSKFYTLFSMLFGLGLAVQLTSAERRGSRVAPTYLRRLAVLFVIGSMHATLIWFGDILHLYALNGVLLWALSRFPLRVLWRLTLALAVLTSLLPAANWLLQPESSATVAEGMSAEEAPNPLYQLMRDASYPEVVAGHAAFHLDEYANSTIAGDESMLYWYLSVLWKFMLGFCIGRAGILQNLAQHGAAIRKLFPWALAIGLAGNALTGAAVVGWDVWIPAAGNAASLLNVPYQLGIVSLAVAYACWLCMKVAQARPPRWVLALAPVGRMALTNYLTHSLLYLLIFYRVGFGAIGQIGATTCMAIGASIFLGQIVFSRWWLGRYRFGPAEWAWRSLTYGKRQPMRRSKSSA